MNHHRSTHRWSLLSLALICSFPLLYCSWVVPKVLSINLASEGDGFRSLSETGVLIAFQELAKRKENRSRATGNHPSIHPSIIEMVVSNAPSKTTATAAVATPGKKRTYRIAMVCDFFYPRMGGVEMHIWSLSQHLVRLGHKVIVLTHSYDDRKGVRYMPENLKVYYCVSKRCRTGGRARNRSMGHRLPSYRRGVSGDEGLGEDHAFLSRKKTSVWLSERS